MKTESPISPLRTLVGAAWAAVSPCLAGSPGLTDDLKLLPPYGELPPGFWQRHGSAVVIGMILLFLAAICIALIVLRQRRAVAIPPDVQARRSLEALVGRPEDGAILSKVSQILRRYLIMAFELPPGEVTTTEFCRMISGHERMGAELAGAVGEFLRNCDERKFSPRPPAQPLNAARRALEFIALAEARRVQPRQTAQA